MLSKQEYMYFAFQQQETEFLGLQVPIHGLSLAPINEWGFLCIFVH